MVVTASLLVMKWNDQDQHIQYGSVLSRDVVAVLWGYACFETAYHSPSGPCEHSSTRGFASSIDSPPKSHL